MSDALGEPNPEPDPIEVSDSLRSWLDGLGVIVGSVIYTYDGDIDIEATKTADGWVCRPQQSPQEGP